MDYLRLLDRRPADLLLERRVLVPRVRRELDRTAAGDRLVERADDAHIGEAFLGGRLGIAVLQHAVGEVEELRGELVALGEAPLAHEVALEAQPMLERSCVFVSRVDRELALCPHQPVFGNLARAEAAGEGREALAFSI